MKKILNAVKAILTAGLLITAIYCIAGVITGGFSKPDIHFDNGPISFIYFLSTGACLLLIVAIWYPWKNKAT